MEETQGKGFDSQPISFALALAHPATRTGRAGSLGSEQMQVRAHSLEARSALDGDRWTGWVAAKGGPRPPPLPFCLAGAQREEEDGVRNLAFLPRVGSAWLWSPVGPDTHSGKQDTLIKQVIPRAQR